ncbi:hypothetical protein P6F26_16230 [Roseibacterium sp. SDUM158017]|uniref:hypothetical protein n=1 Tax=Roseicyclus salinarum TaxID=3036773 RepID=UPI002414F11F|nr:hypothetical protein [Roseibacterium sp. SDUM158017]MDG4649995.1 hypothetical protein [Roseibacterium sp. SDUM158017]
MMRVLGKTTASDAYRVGLRIEGSEVVALVTEALLSAEHGTERRVPHQAAYDWIETRANALVHAVRTLHSGARPRAPFDQITLEPARD